MHLNINKQVRQNLSIKKQKMFPTKTKRAITLMLELKFIYTYKCVYIHLSIFIIVSLFL